MTTLHITFPPSRHYDGWRIKHDDELPSGHWRDGLPEVFILSETSVKMTEAIQRLTKDINVGMSIYKWKQLYGYQTAFTNGSGFGDQADPRRDYLTPMDLDAELPAFHKCLICGGAFVTGRVDGNDLLVDTMNGLDAIPTPAWLFEHPQFYFTAVTPNPKGIYNFPHADGKPVLVPLFCNVQARIPLESVDRWIGDTLPDPYTIYQ